MFKQAQAKTYLLFVAFRQRTLNAHYVPKQDRKYSEQKMKNSSNLCWIPEQWGNKLK